ncbi:hypothetical protein HELRODRAFT_185546 [Helobdella robusta]|uniref:MBD domain-containing protein n=1 Tax=Helobdella robusta TaxID=6412 RepID=T1FMY9_HELRO|nr:hypothetical protein HELRODRAFT_185546 [Helobdella robusta]ESO05075.1 hypothetical protein HELRODRAFT_185546 [Helobdella robusta]
MSLPNGWRREEIVRKNGLSSGKIDVYYYSPDGRKFRSKTQLAKAFRDKIDLSNFDYKTGKLGLGSSTSYHKKTASRHDANVTMPIRQTASIFKQPVTVIKNHTDSKTRTDLKQGTQEQPRQIFWEKRLQGLLASDTTGEQMSSFQLPNSIQSLTPELVGTENLLHSIAAALHLGNQPITGQSMSSVLIQKNPCANINADQPLIQNVVINDIDIQKQEARVLEARKRLQRAMNAVILSSA